ncbi:PREDICTED: uncharacterized protein LOC106321187, partial [Brassica oleracea var. oleracea]|uniref:uncharacterized protein LOC106321187 n=1 Tax=Brassica oleracea var. oleracea TaxID=109376 RepID=UPI0006A6EEEA
MALNVRNKLGFVDGIIPKPPSDSRDSGSWSRCNDMVATWLMNSNLMSRFKQDDAPRVFEIEQRLCNIQQGSLDVSAYYMELHRSRVTKFLMGLNETYETTRRHILILKPIPTIEEAFNMVAQDERQRSIKPVIKTDNVAFQTTCIPSDDSLSYMTPTEYAATYNTHRPRGNRPLCTHCGQLGQTVNKCFKLHGYPPGFKPSSSLSIGYQGQSLPPKQSYGFAPRGQHKYAPHSGFNNQNVQKTVAHVVTVTAPTLQSTPSTTVPDINLLSSTQLQSIIQQLQSRVQVTENVASCSHASITEHGIMAEQSSSVQNNCSAHFFPAYCYLQDVSQGLMIGKGDVVNNLYILNKHAVCESSPSDVFCGSLSVDGSTWHQRLGHPSATKLKMLS